jgi:hypothetical protein
MTHSGNRVCRLRGALVSAGLCLLFEPSPAIAGNQEPFELNLGQSSFFDGFGRNKEGFVFLVYALYSASRSINGNDGKALPTFNNPRIDAFILVNQGVYVFPQTVFWGAANPGFQIVLPLVAFSTSFDPPPPPPGIQLKDNGVGLGDMVIGPVLQFKPIMAAGRPVFSQRFEFDVIAPTGFYDPNKDLNQGDNYTSLNPYWAITVLPLPRLEVSTRLHYLYNFTNNRPANPPPVMPAVQSAQAGQAFWANFALSYEVIERLHLGANGYYFKQFTDDRYTYADGTHNNGQSVRPLGDTGQAHFLTLGPGAYWEIRKEDKLFANAYFTVFAENRPSVTVFNIHYIHEF